MEYYCSLHCAAMEYYCSLNCTSMEYYCSFHCAAMEYQHKPSLSEYKVIHLRRQYTSRLGLAGAARIIWRVNHHFHPAKNPGWVTVLWTHFNFIEPKQSREIYNWSKFQPNKKDGEQVCTSCGSVTRRLGDDLPNPNHKSTHMQLQWINCTLWGSVIRQLCEDLRKLWISHMYLLLTNCTLCGSVIRTLCDDIPKIKHTVLVLCVPLCLRHKGPEGQCKEPNNTF